MHTPDGATCGLVNHMTRHALLSSKTLDTPVLTADLVRLGMSERCLEGGRGCEEGLGTAAWRERDRVLGGRERLGGGLGQVLGGRGWEEGLGDRWRIVGSGGGESERIGPGGRDERRESPRGGQ